MSTVLGVDERPAGHAVHGPAPVAGEARRRPRLRALDGLRGVAVACMVADHVALYAGVEPVRYTVGRVAFPLFFLLGGHLAGRRSWRLLLVALVGAVVGTLAPWSGAAPLLGWFVVGALCLAGCSRRAAAAVLLCCLVAFANPAVFVPYAIQSGYPVPAMLACMALGRLVSRADLLAAGAKLGRWLPAFAALGRYPLTVYAGHVLALTALLGAPA